MAGVPSPLPPSLQRVFDERLRLSPGACARLENLYVIVRVAQVCAELLRSQEKKLAVAETATGCQ